MRTGAVLESPGFVSGLDDLAVVGQTVEQRRRHLGVAEDSRPFAERQIGGDDDRGTLVEPADEMEEQLPAGLRVVSAARVEVRTGSQKVHIGAISEMPIALLTGRFHENIDFQKHIDRPSCGGLARIDHLHGRGNGHNRMTWKLLKQSQRRNRSRDDAKEPRAVRADEVEQFARRSDGFI